MIRCRSCGNSNLDTSQYCDECGAKLIAPEDIHRTDFPAARPLTAEVPIFSGQSATSVGSPPVPVGAEGPADNVGENSRSSTAQATLTIERGDSAGTSFVIKRDESVIGRWD